MCTCKSHESCRFFTSYVHCSTVLHCTPFYAYIADFTHPCEAHASAGTGKCVNGVNCVDNRVQCVKYDVEESNSFMCEYSQCTWNAHNDLHVQHASRTELLAQAMELPVDAYFDAIVSD
mmetsp:Transcript_13050/g.22931  ORF Transcript_13050/g.22931 Transcript_13050/m.22931 type:complete len:119 (-) Transcript_13050:75-431(-)